LIRGRDWSQPREITQNLGMGSRIAVFTWLILLTFALPACQAEPSSQKSNDPADINRATVIELLKVPGMTSSWANRIIRFRPYRSKLDLLNEGVVPPEVYRRIRDSVVAHRPEKDEGKGDISR